MNACSAKDSHFNGTSLASQSKKLERWLCFHNVQTDRSFGRNEFSNLRGRYRCDPSLLIFNQVPLNFLVFDAVLRLEAHGLATFLKTNQGTIAVLTSTAIFDINAESDERQIKACTALEKEPIYSHAKTTLKPSKEPSDLSMKSREKEPPKEPVNNHQRTIKEPNRNQSGTNPEPLTKKEEKEEDKRAAAAYSRTFYKCLDGLDLSDQEKRSLMCYSEHRVAHAAEFVRRKQNVDSPIGLMMWVCQQPSLPELPKENRKSMTPQQKLAWEYNQFLINNGYAVHAKQNEEKIPNDRMVILEQGQPMPITLNNPLQVLQEDFRKSKEEILKSQRIVRELQSDKL